MIDVGAQGRQSDGGVFKNSNMRQRFENGLMDLPEPKELYPEGPTLLFYIIGKYFYYRKYGF